MGDFPVPRGPTQQDVKVISWSPEFSPWHTSFPVSILVIS